MKVDAQRHYVGLRHDQQLVKALLHKECLSGQNEALGCKLLRYVALQFWSMLHSGSNKDQFSKC